MSMPISTIRAIQKFQATETVTDLPGRGSLFILPPCTARRMIREAKNPQGSLLENYRGKQHLGVIKSPKVTHETSPPCQQIIQKACQKKKPFLSFHNKRNHLGFAKKLTLDQNRMDWNYGQIQLKFSFSATNTQVGFGVKRNAYPENNLHVSMVEVEVL